MVFFQCRAHGRFFGGGLVRFLARDHVQPPAVLAFPVVFPFLEVDQKPVAVVADLAKRPFFLVVFHQPVFLAVELDLFRQVQDVRHFGQLRFERLVFLAHGQEFILEALENRFRLIEFPPPCKGSEPA